MENQDEKEEKKQAAADILSNPSSFLMECNEEAVRPSDLKLHLMKELSGMPSTLKSSEKEKLRKLEKVSLILMARGREVTTPPQLIENFSPDFTFSELLAHQEERYEYQRVIGLNINEKNAMFITDIQLEDETRDQSFKLASKIQIGEQGGRVLENSLLKKTEVEVCTNQPNGLRVHCVFSLEEAFVFRLKVDEDGGWGLVIPNQDLWEILQTQFLLSSGLLRIWAFRRAEDETLVFLCLVKDWIVGLDAAVARKFDGEMQPPLSTAAVEYAGEAASGDGHGDPKRLRRTETDAIARLLTSLASPLKYHTITLIKLQDVAEEMGNCFVREETMIRAEQPTEPIRIRVRLSKSEFKRLLAHAELGKGDSDLGLLIVRECLHARHHGHVVSNDGSQRSNQSKLEVIEEGED